MVLLIRVLHLLKRQKFLFLFNMFVLMMLSVSIYEVIYLILEPYNLGYKYTIYHALPGFIFLKDSFNDYIPLLNFCKRYPFPNVQSHHFRIQNYS